MPIRTPCASLVAAGVLCIFATAQAQKTEPSKPKKPGAVEAELRQRLRESNDPFVRHRLGSWLYGQGRVLEARDEWESAAKRERNLPGADVAVGLALAAKGNLDEAEIALKRAEKRADDDPHLFLARGDIALRRKDTVAAEAAIKRAHELAPKLAATNLWMGRFHENRGDFADAETYYRAAGMLSPKQADAWVLLAGLSIREDRIEETLDHLRRAEKLDDDQLPAEARLGSLYAARNDLVGAHQWYTKALERFPKHRDSRLALAALDLRLNREDEAEKHYRVLVADGDDAQAHLLLGQLHESRKEYDSAQMAYEKVLELEPRHVVASNNLAVVLLCKKRSPQEIVRLAEAAHAAAPNHPAVRSTYACALAEAGKVKEALDRLEKAVRHSPSDDWVRYMYGKLLIERDPKAARDHLRGCLLLNPEFPRKNEVRSLLDSLPVGQ